MACAVGGDVCHAENVHKAHYFTVSDPFVSSSYRIIDRSRWNCNYANVDREDVLRCMEGIDRECDASAG